MPQPDEYCLLWINWWVTCLTKSEWASWMQALGALLALAIAIYVPHRLHAREREHDRQTEVARAHVAAASVALLLQPAIGMLQAFVDQASMIVPGRTYLNAREWHDKFIGLIKPTDEQVLMLEPGNRSLAVAVARGFYQVEQMKLVILGLYNKNDALYVTTQMIVLIPLANLAIGQLTSAAGLMDRFVTSIEGPEVIGPEQAAKKG